MTDANATRVGVFIASGIGGFSTIEREHKALLEGGPRRISPFFIPASIINLAAGQVSIRFDAKGPNSATCTACSASAHAIGDAFEIIKRDDADVMIAGRLRSGDHADGRRRVRGDAGAVDPQRRSARTPAGRSTATATASSWARAPASSSSKSSSMRSARGAPIYAELVGYGMSADAFHITAPSEDGDGGMRVMQKALRVGAASRRTQVELHQRARHLDAVQRQARDAGDQAAFRRPRPRPWRSRPPSR